MICFSARSRFRWLRQLCALACVLFGCCALPASRAQELDKPLQTIEGEVTAFAFAPDGRIAYSIRRVFKTKEYDLQRDDIWLQDSNNKRRRLLAGEKFTRGNAPFTYAVDSLRWSPNGRLILAELFTTAVIDPDTGKTQDTPMTFVLDDSGKEIKLGGNDSVIKDSLNASWILDSSTIIYLTEAVKPRALFSFRYATISNGLGGSAFEGRTFMDSDRLPGVNAAIAIERDRTQSGPPRLQRLDLLAQDDKELATLEGYAGGLTVSPSGKKVAYFIDNEVLEVRDLTSPDRVARLRIGLGIFHWSPDESRILLKRAPERKTADLVWIDVPQLAAPPRGTQPAVSQPTPSPILHDLGFRDFAFSADGRFLGVVPPGQRNLLLFPIPR